MDWLWIFFEVCNAFFEVLMMKTLAEGFLKNKRIIPKYVGVFVFLSVVALSFSGSMVFNGVFYLLTVKTILLSMIIAFSCSRSNVLWCGIVGTIYYLFIGISEFIGMYIISFVHDIHFVEMIDLGIYRYQAIVIVDIIFFLFIKLICRFKKEEVHSIPLQLWGILCLLPVFSVLVLLQMIFVSSDERKSVTVLSVLSVLSLLFINVLIFYVIERLVRQMVNEERIAALETQLSLQKAHVERIVESRSQLEQLSHDFKHHIQTFRALSEMEQYVELSERIKELSLQQKRIEPMLNTKNPALDALLSLKKETAEQYEIQWVWDIKIPPELPVPIIDICTILGNALDNAIEACLRAKENRHILLKIYANDYALLFEIRNTVGFQPIIKDGFLQSQKNDGKIHGIGLKSITEYCKRLHGDISYDYDDAEFELRILIPIEH